MMRRAETHGGRNPGGSKPPLGKWLDCCAGWWLFPKDSAWAPEVARALEAARKRVEEIDSKLAELDDAYVRALRPIVAAVGPLLPEGADKRAEIAHVQDALDSVLETIPRNDRRFRVIADAIREHVGPRGRLLGERENVLYSAQLDWSLHQIKVRSSIEAQELIEEFRRYVQLATDEFCWRLTFIDAKMALRKHSWKHSTFEALVALANDVRSRRYPPVPMLVDLIGSDKEACELFRRAERGDAEAVARVNFLYPSKSARIEAARHLFEYNKEPAEKIPFISSAPDQAADYVEIIMRDPDSSAAQQARKHLERLISQRARKGSPIQKGRAPTPYHEDGIKLLFRISYGLFIQLRRVNQVAASYNLSKPNVLRQFYPELPSDLDSFLHLEPSDGACQIAGKALSISPSLIDKIVFPRRPAK